MKVIVKDISPQGLFLEENSSGEELDIERDDIKFIQPVLIKAEVTIDQETVNLKITASSRIQITCNRCLKEYEQELRKKIKLIKSATEDPIIDLTQIMREEIIIEYPIKFLCGDSCQGICAGCGNNLNDKKCDCSKEKEPFRGLPLNIEEKNN